MSSPSTKGRTGSIRVGELLNPTSAKDFLKPTVSMIEIALNKPLREEDSTFTLGGVDWGSGGRAQSSTSLSAAGPLHQYQMSPRALSPNTIARPLWPQDVSMAYGAPPDSVQHSAQRTATLGSYTPGMPAPAAYQQPAFPQHQKQQSKEAVRTTPQLPAFSQQQQKQQQLSSHYRNDYAIYHTPSHSASSQQSSSSQNYSRRPPSPEQLPSRENSTDSRYLKPLPLYPFPDLPPAHQQQQQYSHRPTSPRLPASPPTPVASLHPLEPQLQLQQHAQQEQFASQQRPPELDLTQYQTNQRPSMRLLRLGEASHGIGRQSSLATLLEDRTRPGKRGVFDVEDAEEPAKTKRKLSAKLKEQKAPNKRSGYTAKKRSEAAQIAAMNDSTPSTMYRLTPVGSGEDAPFHDVPVPFSVEQNILREPQASRCMSNGYKHDDIYRCVSCTRRWAGDTCRFQNIRSFCRDSDGRLIAYTFQEQPTPSPALNYPNEWNIPLEKSHIDETKKIIALALLPILHEELQHITLPRVIFRPRESEVRATCDTCLTSIFSCSWMCRICGRESCGECFEHVKNLTIEPTGSPSKIEELRARRDKHAHAFPSFLNCMKRAEHGAKDFLPVTRFIKQELAEAVGDMEQFLRRESISVEQPAATSRSQPSVTTSSDQGSTSNSSGPRTPPDMAMSPLSSDSEATLVAASYPADLQPTIASGSVEEIPSHEIQRFQDSELTEEVFRPIWRKGDPILVTDVGRKLKIKWSPQYFMEKYGTQSCLIIDCQAEILNKRITVAEFFSTFGIYEDRDQCWKLKDWPPSSDFKSEFPELYQDFSEAVPIPNYVRRDGALNIASHFPSNTVGPDLGPKMYNAYANQDDSGKGSTRLHMDMADALNIMTFAAIGPDGQPGRAAWDLFCAQDSDKIRKFLHGKYPELKGQDPIHRQTVYLDDVARRELWQEYGVKSYRVYQMAGEAVFIPAGCAHQVRNLSDCIKVAIDFVSPENIERCEKLTREFRALAWKEDVLQLRTMMWFAWLSCCRQEKLAAEEAS